jgi:hypothetical protein
MDKRELAYNFRAIMMFEKLSGESYFNISEDNYIYLIYAMYMVKHPYLNMTILDFIKVLGNNKKLAKSIMSEFEEYMTYMQQYMVNSDDVVDAKDIDDTKKNGNMTNTITYLIVECGIDPHYVMNEMELWEVRAFMKAQEKKKKEELELDRLWTYFNMSPHIDTKKCKSPDKLMPFPWEKEENKIRQNKELENNRFAIQNMIGKSIFANKEVNNG